jgi:hypothetical protein
LSVRGLARARSARSTPKAFGKSSISRTFRHRPARLIGNLSPSASCGAPVAVQLKVKLKAIFNFTLTGEETIEEKREEIESGTY